MDTNNCRLPINVSFERHQEVHAPIDNKDMVYGTFYIGQFDGYHYWSYLDRAGQAFRVLEKNSKKFHFIDQLKTNHPNRKSDAKGPKGFSFV